MKELIIDRLGSNQRLDKYLAKYLSAANKSFIYKMLRKKNITLNNKKADGSEKLMEGDSVKIFFSDETLEKFTEGIKLLTISLIINLYISHWILFMRITI